MERRDFLKKSVLAALGTAVAGTGIVEAFNYISDNKSKTSKMKIVVLTGSPRKNGNSAYLAEQFIKGAEEKGHEVFRFDCAFELVEPCRACNRCGMNGPCIFNDDFQELRPRLIEADMVVFATPMYYFGFSAQMKRVIDRFYAINGQIKGVSKKAALLMAYSDTSQKEAEPMRVHYHTLMDYLGWTSVGEVVASGVWTAGSVQHTDYPQQAYQLGKSL
ncbi:flavodoxin family protein [Bacteroides mediterraneensis]|uniref:flavodoxin family protein n=1 Tax=Bacteroides mediterraneensis TaxID=1841856 RepID=UPI0019579848|nr:flavodoxin family protein [Bacteroides mediterraneensis]MBM6781728.1 flavodoxin family protein [Bacteroides mediterraneensis]